MAAFCYLRIIMKTLTYLIFITLLLSACGQTGPLILPDKDITPIQSPTEEQL